VILIIQEKIKRACERIAGKPANASTNLKENFLTSS
jgi:hypothetical protein